MDSAIEKIKEYVSNRMDCLFGILPDSYRDEITETDNNNLGRFMELEQLEDFLENLEKDEEN